MHDPKAENPSVTADAIKKKEEIYSVKKNFFVSMHQAKELSRVLANEQIVIEKFSVKLHVEFESV